MKGGYAFHNKVNLSTHWDGTPGSLFMASQITAQLNHNYGLIMSSHSTPLQNRMLTPSCMLFRVFKTELQLLHEWIIDLLSWDLRVIFHVRNVRTLFFFFFNRFESQVAPYIPGFGIVIFFWFSSGCDHSCISSGCSCISWSDAWETHLLLWQCMPAQGNICPRAAALRCKDIQSSTFVAVQNWWFEPSLIRFQHGSVWSNVEAEKMLLPQGLFLSH